MFGCAALEGYVAVAGSGQNSFITVKKGKVEVFRSPEFYFRILKVQLHRVGSRVLLVVATDKIVIFELQEAEDKLTQVQRLSLDTEDDFGVTDFYCVEQGALVFLTASGAVYAAELTFDPAKGLQTKTPKKVDRDVVAIGKCVRGREANLRGQSAGRFMVVKRNP